MPDTPLILPRPLGQAVPANPRADRVRALTLSLGAFTISFAVWTLFGILGVRIQRELGLNQTEFGLLVATPVLTGSLSRPFLGIAFSDVDAEMAAQFRLPVREGVLVTDVQAGSPAARGGVRSQDIITRVNDTPIAMGGDVRRVLRALKPGDTVRLSVVRPPDGARATLTVRLGQTTQ